MDMGIIWSAGEKWRSRWVDVMLQRARQIRSALERP
jgi:hypothetical protein